MPRNVLGSEKEVMSKTDKISSLIELAFRGGENYTFKRITKKCFRIKGQCVLWRKIKQKYTVEWRKLGGVCHFVYSGRERPHWESHDQVEIWRPWSQQLEYHGREKGTSKSLEWETAQYFQETVSWPVWLNWSIKDKATSEYRIWGINCVEPNRPMASSTLHEMGIH